MTWSDVLPEHCFVAVGLSGHGGRSRGVGGGTIVAPPPLGGASGGEPPGDMSSSSRRGVGEQIAVALERLQADMDNVLTRLQSLEALSLAHNQLRATRLSDEQVYIHSHRYCWN